MKKVLALALALLAAAYRGASETGDAAHGLVAHALHHLRGLLETLQQRVHLRNGHAGTVRDTSSTRTVNN